MIVLSELKRWRDLDGLDKLEMINVSVSESDTTELFTLDNTNVTCCATAWRRIHRRRWWERKVAVNRWGWYQMKNRWRKHGRRRPFLKEEIVWNQISSRQRMKYLIVADPFFSL